MWYLSSWRDLRRRSNAGHGLGNKPEITPPSHSYHRPDGTERLVRVLWYIQGGTMKLLRYGDSGRERPGMLDAGGRIRDLSSVVPDIAGATLLPESLARLLVSYISQFMSLQPRDVISTGTPPGVGLGQKPPLYLKPGQTMRLGIAGLGEQRQTTVAA